MAMLLSGRPVADALYAQTAAKAKRLVQRGFPPKLAILQVGRREDDISYIRGVLSLCSANSIEVTRYCFSDGVTQKELADRIDALNDDGTVDGILLLLPLPPHLDSQALCRRIAPEKDVDGMTAYALAGALTGAQDSFPACTPAACMEILRHYQIDCAGKHAVVLGRSNVVGKPMAMLLLAADATVTICHSKTPNWQALCRQADIVVAATGQKQMLGADAVKPGAVVLDVGIHWDSAAKRLVGDVDFAAVSPLAGAITPVPGGVGAVTTAVLLSHVACAAERNCL